MFIFHLISLGYCEYQRNMRATQTLSRLRGCPLTRFNTCCLQNSTKLQVRHSATILNTKFKQLAPAAVKIRSLGLGPTSKDFEDSPQFTSPLTKVHANELVLHLTDEERKVLFNALQQYESNRIKDEYEGESNRINIDSSSINNFINLQYKHKHFICR